MTLTIDAASTPIDADGSRPNAPGHQVAASRRGRTTVARSVVEAIVAQVATQTPGVAAVELGGIREWFASHHRPGVAAVGIEGPAGGLHIELGLAIEYPRAVTEVVGEVRRRVIVHLEHRLDLQVSAMDVRVVELRRSRMPVTIDRRVR